MHSRTPGWDSVSEESERILISCGLQLSGRLGLA